MKDRISKLYDDLQSAREATFSIISEIDRLDLEKKGEEKWSIAHILEHLYLSELGSNKVVKVLIKRSEDPLPPYPENESSIEFNEPKQPPGKLICPKVVTPPEEVSLDGAIENLKDIRKSTRETLILLSTVDPTSRSMEHPFFGECNMYEWFSFLLDHERVHQEQIKDIGTKVRVQ